mgnify:CR=1 FL=1
MELVRNRCGIPSIVKRKRCNVADAEGKPET